MFSQERYPHKGFSLRSNSPVHLWSSNKAKYIRRIMARIGRDRPLYADRYGEIALKIISKITTGPGVYSLMKGMGVDEYGKYLGNGCGRFVAIGKTSGDFELYEFDMWKKPDSGPMCWLEDWYKCEGCGRMRDKGIDPPKMEYANDCYQWRRKGESTAFSRMCCKKCRAELRRITRETQILAENRTLINQLNREIRNVANQDH